MATRRVETATRSPTRGAAWARNRLRIAAQRLAQIKPSAMCAFAVSNLWRFAYDFHCNTFRVQHPDAVHRSNARARVRPAGFAETSNRPSYFMQAAQPRLPFCMFSSNWLPDRLM